MEARLLRAALLAAVLASCMGARFSTPNFIVETPDPRLAQQFAQAAEKYRRDLALEWLGKAMPDWSQPCLITVHVGQHLGAGGATSFVFDQGEVFGWRMTIQGSAERVLDSVLPHEITHMIFASRFRQPLPRWADEGGATSVEHPSERMKQRQMLVSFLRNGRGIAFSQMFAMQQYPADVMPLYAQGYSLAEFLIQKRGRRAYVEFLDDGLKTGDWAGAVRSHYGIDGAGKLQDTWLAWVRQGSPALKPTPDRPNAAPERPQVAAKARRPRPEPNLLVRVPKEQAPAYAPGSVIPAGDSRLNPILGLAAAGGPYRPRPVQRDLAPGGWHALGAQPPAPAPLAASPGPVRSQVTRPQAFQQPQPSPPNVGRAFRLTTPGNP
jgi:hypothetical protein